MPSLHQCPKLAAALNVPCREKFETQPLRIMAGSMSSVLVLSLLAISAIALTEGVTHENIKDVKSFG